MIHILTRLNCHFVRCCCMFSWNIVCRTRWNHVYEVINWMQNALLSDIIKEASIKKPVTDMCYWHRLWLSNMDLQKGAHNSWWLYMQMNHQRFIHSAFWWLSACPPGIGRRSLGRTRFPPAPLVESIWNRPEANAVWAEIFALSTKTETYYQRES